MVSLAPVGEQPKSAFDFERFMKKVPKGIRPRTPPASVFERNADAYVVGIHQRPFIALQMACRRQPITLLWR
jgi:hypothetical protein